MKHYILTIIILICILSCKSVSKPNFDYIKECTNYNAKNRVHIKINKNEKIDFYEAISDFENVLLINNFLPKIDKKSYKKIISKLDNKSVSLDSLKHIKIGIDSSFKENNIYNISGRVNALIFRCFNSFINKNPNFEKSPIATQAKHGDYLLANYGLYYPKQALYPLIDTVEDEDFEKEIIYRSALLLLIYDNIEELVHPSKPRLPINENKEVN